MKLVNEDGERGTNYQDRIFLCPALVSSWSYKQYVSHYRYQCFCLKHKQIAIRSAALLFCLSSFLALRLNYMNAWNRLGKGNYLIIRHELGELPVYFTLWTRDMFIEIYYCSSVHKPRAKEMPA